MIKRVDSGGQVHLVTNIRKPRKWRRYEYLLSSGTLYINTGYIPNNFTKAIIDFQVVETNDGFFFGSRDGFLGSLCFALHNNYCLFGDDMGSATTSSSTDRFVMSLSQEGTYKNGTLIKSYSTKSFTAPGPLLLYTTYSGNSPRSPYARLKVYSFKVYDKDILIRDFVPAQYNGEYGMWDLVEDRFYPNKGTGTFTVGPEIKNYDEIYEVRKTTSLLPSGVELYDYILSSGTLWIDTNYIPNQDTNCEAKAQFITSNAYTSIALVTTGGSPLTNRFTLMANGNDTFYFGKGTDIKTYSTTVTSLHIYKIDGLKCYIDGTYVQTLKLLTFTAENTIPLFADRRSGNINQQACLKLYYFKFYNGSTLVRNFLPCTYLGEPGMWDTVENKFYRNQGTGLFTLGNKITLKEYEYLQSSGTLYINTGYTHNSTTWIETRLAFTRVFSYNTLFGAATSDNSADSFTVGCNANGGFNCDLNKGYNPISGTAGVITANTIYNIKVWPKTLIANNVTYNTTTTTTNSCLYPISIFIRNLGNTFTSEKGEGRIYSFKIYEGVFNNGGELKRDFIPISHNGTPGLWDKVEWKFYANAGSGSFTLGPEKKSGVYPVWTPIEYLESTGTLWIDTGLLLNTFKILHDALVLSRAGNLFSLISCWSDSNRFFNLYTNDSSSIRFYSGTSALISDNWNRHTYIIDRPDTTNFTVSVDGTLKISSTSTLTSSAVTIKISRRGDGNADYSNGSGRFFGTKIWTNNQLIRDLIPVRIENTGYMFDKITGKMYGNAGTGSFTLGPDL